jgi:ELWxxDGT repeat protein
MFFKNRKSLIARIALIVALLGGMVGSMPIQAVHAMKSIADVPQLIGKEVNVSPQAQVETAVLVKDIYPGSAGSIGNIFKSVSGILYFGANDGVTGSGLWKSDGTTDGTVLVKGGFVSAIQYLESANGLLYFATNDGISGSELWKSDGTAAGTVLVQDIRLGSSGSFPSAITSVNGTVYFKANDGTYGIELWKSDGTPSGTVLVKDIISGSGSPNIDNLIDVNATLFFTADDGIHGHELWKSDGTSDGTVMVKDIYPGWPGSSYYHMMNINGIVYFSASSDVSGYELWKSNGTDMGTVLVRDIWGGTNSSYPDSFENVNGTLFFTANNGVNGNELWKSNGTSAGTVMVKDIWPGSSGWGSELSHVGNIVYFGANDGVNMRLWKSDGTSAGTMKIGAPGPLDIGSANGIVYYSGSDGVNGYELWRSDGTASGTALVKDINPTGDSSPDQFIDVNGTLYFRANDGVHGTELWKVTFTPQIHHVKWDATGANNGSSWTDAYTDLQTALAAASSGDEIWVAAGTYKPTDGIDRTISFVLKNDVAIYGGFDGTETLRTQRDPVANVSILSGDIGVIDITADNSYHVVVGSDTDSTTILDGFTITGGNASENDASFPNNVGGGLYNSSGDPTLTNLVFTLNAAGYGAGMFNYFSNPAVAKSIFINNTSSRGSGGMGNSSSSPTLNDLTFSNNWGHSGAGMANDLSNPILINVTFHANNGYWGGGISNNASSPILTNVTFSNNIARDGSGGGGMVNGENSNPTLTNVTFGGNSAGNVTGGRGVYNYNGSIPNISNSIFWNDGSEIYNSSVAPVINDSIIQGGCPAGSTCTNIINADPKLGLLANNGGYTQTFALLPGSPAIDAGNNTTCAATDQRGIMRPQGDHCDIGAYEYVPMVTSITRVETSPTNADSLTFRATFSEPVQNVDASDFTVTGTTALISAPITSDGGLTYGITISGGNLASLNGVVGLDLANTQDIEDLSGNSLADGDPAIDETYVLDNIAPNTQIESQPANPSNTSAATFSFSSADPSATLECQLDGSGFTACGSPKNYTSLADGSHSFEVRATDAAGNVDATPASYTWTIYTVPPGAASLVSPNGNSGLTNPTYTWNEVAGATWYYLWVNRPNSEPFQHWYTAAQAGCNGSTCSISNATPGLVAGTYTWWIQTWNPIGDGPWSTGMTFSPLPGQATLTSPTGSLNQAAVYTWEEVPGATWYYLWVNGPTGNVHKQWYTAAAANCDGTTCSLSDVTPGLTAGTHTWWIQTWNATGDGPWSEPMTFTPVLPAAATLVSPSGNSGLVNPTYSWNEVPGATQYYLWVEGPAGNVHKVWYTSVDANCDGTICSLGDVTPGLTAGTYTWWIQAENEVGKGPWSGAMTFNTLPDAATLVSPNGPDTNNPTYTWEEVPGATWYYLWVNGSTGNVHKQWYTAAAASCDGTTCSLSDVTPGLTAGTYTWWIQTWNATGDGPWSTGVNFTVP